MREHSHHSKIEPGAPFSGLVAFLRHKGRLRVRYEEDVPRTDGWRWQFGGESADFWAEAVQDKDGRDLIEVRDSASGGVIRLHECCRGWGHNGTDIGVYWRLLDSVSSLRPLRGLSASTARAEWVSTAFVLLVFVGIPIAVIGEFVASLFARRPPGYPGGKWLPHHTHVFLALLSLVSIAAHAVFRIRMRASEFFIAVALWALLWFLKPG